MVVENNEDGKEYDQVGAPVFSPDSKHMAYPVAKGGKMFIVMDGQEGKPFDQVGEPFFSPDSRHIAYWASIDGGWYIVVDTKISKNRFDGPVKNSPLIV